jgi:hypothetical protein
VTEWSPVDLLPGLYTGVLALLLWSALRRWYDAVPVRVLAVFVLVLLVLFGPVLFGGKLLLPLDGVRGQVPFQNLPPAEPHGNLLQGDLLQLVAPSLAAVRTAYGEGRWPLWNPLAGVGTPLLADPQSQALQPIALAALPLPWWRAAGVMAALRVLLALTFTNLWMRRQGLGEGPALAGALAFGLSGFVLLWVGWPIANSAALLPAVLYALARCRQVGERKDFLLLSISTAALLLGGHPETVLYALGVALAYGLASSGVWGRPSPGEGVLGWGGRGVGGEGLRRLLLALVVSASVAAPALLPALESLPDSLRSTRPLTHPTGDLARHWLPIAAPNSYGNSRYVHYWGLANTNEDAGGFVGTVTLLAALTWSRKRLPQEWLFLGIAVVCLALLSPWAPGTRRLLLPLALSLAYLGACTLERVRLGEVSRWTVILAAVVLGMVIAWGYLAHGDPSGRLEILRIGWLHWQGRFLILGALLLVFGRGKRWTAPAVAGLIAAELLLAHLPANPPMPKRLLLPENGPTRFLEDHLRDGGRMTALGRDFPPNLATLYGLADIRVYNPMAPAAYLRRLEPIITGWWGEMPELGNPGHPLYAELGVRYILTAPGAALPPPLRPVFQDQDGWIWEVPGAQPASPRNQHRPWAFLAGMLVAAAGLAAGAALFTAPAAPTRSGAPG